MSTISDKVGSGMLSVIQGRAVSSRFFKEHFFATSIVVIICLATIAVRFQCAMSQNKIERLERQINVMCTEKQRERSRYMTITRESAMTQLVDSLQLGLSVPDRRPQIVIVP